MKDPASAAVVRRFDAVLGVLGAGGVAAGADQRVQSLCEELDAARAAKDYDRADALRSEIVEAGYDVKTTREGTVATKRLA